MTHSVAATTEGKAGMAFLLASRPTAPANTKLPVKENRISDPSASTPRGTSYPIPDFFDYRAKAREFDSL